MNRRNAYLVPIQTQHSFEPIMALVLNAVDSPNTRRAYRRKYVGETQRFTDSIADRIGLRVGANYGMTRVNQSKGAGYRKTN